MSVQKHLVYFLFDVTYTYGMLRAFPAMKLTT